MAEALVGFLIGAVIGFVLGAALTWILKHRARRAHIRDRQVIDIRIKRINKKLVGSDPSDITEYIHTPHRQQPVRHRKEVRVRPAGEIPDPSKG